MRIVIDPGHGGDDRENVGPTGYVEADGVLDIGLKLRNLLIQEGYDVKMTREVDKTVELIERSNMANEWRGQLLISLHTNAAASPEANGIETFHSYNGQWGDIFREEAMAFAEVLQNNLVSATGLVDRGIKIRLIDNLDSNLYGKDYYSIIRNTKMPSVITEMGFHTNPKEEALLKTEEFRNLLAKTIFESIKEVYPIMDKAIEERNITLIVHGRERKVEGFFSGGKHYVPIRFLEAFGYELSWDETNNSIIIEYKTE